MNEFDRFIKHNLKPKAYLRYGDDFIMVEPDFRRFNFLKTRATDFLRDVLKLQVHPKSNRIFKARHGLKFLGVVIWSHDRKLNKRNSARVCEKLTLNNASSYYGSMKHHANYKKMREFYWRIFALNQL